MLATRHASSGQDDDSSSGALDALILAAMLSKARKEAEEEKPTGEKRIPIAESSRTFSPPPPSLAAAVGGSSTRLSQPQKATSPAATTTPIFKYPTLSEQRKEPERSTPDPAPQMSTLSRMIQARLERERAEAANKSRKEAESELPTPGSIAEARRLHEQRTAAMQSIAARRRQSMSQTTPPATAASTSSRKSTRSPTMRWEPVRREPAARFKAPEKKTLLKPSAPPKFRVPVLSESEKVAISQNPSPANLWG